MIHVLAGQLGRLVGLWASSLLAAALGLFAQILFTRALGPHEFGALSAALATATIAGPLSSLGVGPWLFKVFGEEGKLANRWLRPAIKLVLVATAMCLICTYAWSFIAPLDTLSRELLRIAIPTLLLQTAVELSVAIALLEDRHAAVLFWQAARNWVRFLGAGLAFVIGLSVEATAGVLTATSLIVVCLSLSALVRSWVTGITPAGHSDDGFRFGDDVASVWRVLRESWSYGASGVLHVVYLQGNVVLLGMLRTSVEVGIYSAAVIVLTAVHLVPSVTYQRFLLPKIHRWAAHDRASLLYAYRLGNTLLLVGGCVAAVALIVLSPSIVSAFFPPEYASARTVVNIFAVGLPFKFLQFGVSNILATQDHMRRRVHIQTWWIAGSTGLAVLLINNFSYIGAAISLSVSEAVLLILYLWAARRFALGSDALRNMFWCPSACVLRSK